MNQDQERRLAQLTAVAWIKHAQCVRYQWPGGCGGYVALQSPQIMAQMGFAQAVKEIVAALDGAAHEGGAVSEARSYPACKGRNCGCTDGHSHSAECQKEHDDACNGVLGPCSVPMWWGSGVPAGRSSNKSAGGTSAET